MSESVYKRSERVEKFNEARCVEEMKMCMTDPVYFITHYGTILNAKTREFETFDLWPEQIEFVRGLQKYDRIVDVKAKQLGITWILVNFAYWDIWHPKHENIQIGVVAHTEKAAQAFINRIKIVHDKMPTWLRPDDVSSRSVHQFTMSEKVLIDGVVDEVKGRMNWIRAFASTENFLRGESPSRAFFDEADFIDDLEDMLPTVIGSMAESQGQLVFNSTPHPQGLGNFFYKMFWGAGESGNQFEYFHKYFFSYKISPSRNAEWEKKNRQELGERFRIEHPSTPQEAWQAAGGCFFDVDLLSTRIQELIDSPSPARIGELIYRENPQAGQLPFEFVPRENGWLYLWKTPVPDHLYSLGGDPSGGGKTGDDAVAVVLDDDTGEVVAMIVGKILPDEFAYKIRDLAMWYNRAFTGVEANTGTEVNRLLVNPNECGYYNVYLREELDTITATSSNKLGFLMGNYNKLPIYQNLEICWRQRRVIIYDIDTLYEMQNITWLSKTRIGTTGKQADNRPDALAIALEMHRVRPTKSKENVDDLVMKKQYDEIIGKIQDLRKQGKFGIASNPYYDPADISEGAESYLV